MTSPTDKVDCIFCHGTGKLAFSEETRKLAQRAVEAQRNDTRTMDEKIRDGVSFILGPDAPDDPAQEGYPGIAHDFETMRSALVQIRDECFNGHAHDIAEAALNAAPQSEGTRDAGLPDAGRREPADAALSPGRPAAVAAPNSSALPSEPMPRTFEYLLNAMEHAANAHNPHREGYAEKRKAVFQHVQDLWDDYLRLLREKQDKLNAPASASEPICPGWHRDETADYCQYCGGRHASTEGRGANG